jgi:hypothetical protein
VHLSLCCRLSVVAVLVGNLNSSHGTGVILMGQSDFMVHSSAGRADTAGCYEREKVGSLWSQCYPISACGTRVAMRGDRAICDGQLPEGVT